MKDTFRQDSITISLIRDETKPPQIELSKFNWEGTSHLTFSLDELRDLEDLIVDIREVMEEYELY